MKEKESVLQTVWQVLKILFWIAAASACLWFVWANFRANVDCYDAGKVPVQGVPGYECVSP